MLSRIFSGFDPDTKKVLLVITGAITGFILLMVLLNFVKELILFYT